MIGGVKNIKFNAWEELKMNEIIGLRNSERILILRQGQLFAA